MSQRIARSSPAGPTHPLISQTERVTGVGVAEQDDDRRALEVDIADGLAALSQSESRPTEVEARSAGYSSGEVDFNDGSWLVRVAEVQDWLRLAGQISLQDAPEGMATALFRGLGFERDPFETRLDGVAVNERGLERLRERIDQAIQHRDRFVEAIEDGLSAEGATVLWVEAWEATTEEESSGPVEATASTWPIQNFADRARRGNLNLSPSYQRGDVWPTKDAQLLIESILRGIPLPSVIILKPQDDDKPFEVVDGKQRLTAILRFIGSHPRAIAHVKSVAAQNSNSKLVELFRDDYSKFRTAWKNATGEQLTASREKELYFPFRLRKGETTLKGPDLQPLVGNYYHQIKDKKVRVGGEKVEIRDIFESTTKYLIPLIEYTNASPRQIHEVFNLYNRQGKHLNAEEIRNAVYHSLDITRAIAFASGDAEDIDAVRAIAPIETQLRQLGRDLEAYGFGTSRYRRTKVLSWLMSLIFVDSSFGEGRARLRSTAQQTNELLDRIERTPKDPFHAPETIRRALSLVADSVVAHSTADDAWAPKFKDNAAGTKWQELQLVASLLGVSLASTVLADGIEDALLRCEDDLRERSNGPTWMRPKKTQTGTQWAYIATVALDIIDVLGVRRQDVTERLVATFGASSVPTLEYAAANAD